MKRLVALVAVAAIGLVGCSTSPTSSPASSPTPSSAASGAGLVSVVASTNVYGDIVKTIGGPAVVVTSIIDNPEKDPHEYEADARTQLALSKAQLVIENGGGYDDFVDTMLNSAQTKPTVINVADVSGRNQHPSDGEFNEHLWYDFPTVEKLAAQLVTDLSAAAPGQAATFNSNAKAFTAQLDQLQQDEAAIKAEHAGEGVAITEPVPLYLLEAAGLVNKTPETFGAAIEEDTDVPPAVLKETEDLFDTKQVKLLAYNQQTTGPQTEAVLAAAKRNNIRVVPVTETLPTDQSYLSWMQANLRAVSSALTNDRGHL
ncbi:MAG TPA: zinc ABC transporter substrate-binding protein [Propionibacteriaceae bacterium]|nr:zinc ABC transporter substrate-binding protein [Propionibacteriaceae bacterium]